jgi:hypothetical protein
MYLVQRTLITFSQSPQHDSCTPTTQALNSLDYKQQQFHYILQFKFVSTPITNAERRAAFCFVSRSADSHTHTQSHTHSHTHTQSHSQNCINPKLIRMKELISNVFALKGLFVPIFKLHKPRQSNLPSRLSPPFNQFSP